MSDKWMICPVCEGEGSHVNPSIDAHGISPEEFHQDPDFAEAYFSGAYDVSCKNCRGSGKVLTAKQAERDAAWEDELSDRHQRMAESGCYEPGWQDRRW